MPGADASRGVFRNARLEPGAPRGPRREGHPRTAALLQYHGFNVSLASNGQITVGQRTLGSPGSSLARALSTAALGGFPYHTPPMATMRGLQGMLSEG